MCLQQQPLIQERLLLQPLGDEPPAAPASATPSSPAAAGTGQSWLSRLSALLCCLPSPVSLLKAAYVRWYDARARRRFLRRQQRWRRDCAEMAAAADPERGQLVTAGGGGGGGGVQKKVDADGEVVSMPYVRLVGVFEGSQRLTASLYTRLVVNSVGDTDR